MWYIITRISNLSSVDLSVRSGSSIIGNEGNYWINSWVKTPFSSCFNISPNGDLTVTEWTPQLGERGVKT